MTAGILRMIFKHWPCIQYSNFLECIDQLFYSMKVSGIKKISRDFQIDNFALVTTTGHTNYKSWVHAQWAMHEMEK